MALKGVIQGVMGGHTRHMLSLATGILSLEACYDAVFICFGLEFIFFLM